MLNIKIIANGNLELSLETATELDNSLGYWSNMADLFEPYPCNGSFTHFDAGSANPFIGLTSAPCIAESMSIDDDGKQTIDGRVWAFAEYQTACDLAQLIATGKAIYTLI